jgi:hypothetical protein
LPNYITFWGFLSPLLPVSPSPSQVNIPNNIFLIRYLTTYITYDIFTVCTKKKERLSCFAVPDAVMSGFLAILKKNLTSAPILNAIVLTGKNHVRASKRRWFEMSQLWEMGVNRCE